jgi:hypothetical protein
MWTTSYSTTDTLGHTVQNTWLIVANWKLRRHADFLVQLFCVWKLSAYQLRLFKVIHSWAVVIMGVPLFMSNSCHCHFRCSVPVMRYSYFCKRWCIMVSVARTGEADTVISDEDTCADQRTSLNIPEIYWTRWTKANRKVGRTQRILQLVDWKSWSQQQ